MVISGCAARAEATVALYAPKAGGSGAFGTSGHGEMGLSENVRLIFPMKYCSHFP